MNDIFTQEFQLLLKLCFGLLPKIKAKLLELNSPFIYTTTSTANTILILS